jgi:hypothetical protein
VSDVDDDDVDIQIGGPGMTMEEVIEAYPGAVKIAMEKLAAELREEKAAHARTVALWQERNRYARRIPYALLVQIVSGSGMRADCTWLYESTGGNKVVAKPIFADSSALIAVEFYDGNED